MNSKISLKRENVDFYSTSSCGHNEPHKLQLGSIVLVQKIRYFYVRNYLDHFKNRLFEVKGHLQEITWDYIEKFSKMILLI